MNIELTNSGIVIKAEDWKEEQVFKLYLKELLNQHMNTLIVHNYQDEPVYEFEIGAGTYIGGQQNES